MRTPSEAPSASLCRQIVEAIEDLPVLPTVAARVLSLAHDPNSSMQDICEAIRTDPSLTAHLLRIVNSPYYGFSRQIGTVAQATVILGTNEIIAVVLGSTTLKSLGSRARTIADEAAFWSHSARTSVAARVVAAQMRYRLPGVAFVAGLLHDTGKLILADLFPDRFQQAMQQPPMPDAAVEEAEQQLFGADHTQIGAALAGRWGLPDEIVQAIRCHHRPEEAAQAAAQLVDVVHVANHLVRASDVDTGANLSISPASVDRFRQHRPDFDATFLQKLAADMERDLERADGLVRTLGGASDGSA